MITVDHLPPREPRSAARKRRPDTGAPIMRLALRLDEIAGACGISRRTLDRLRSAGKFPAPSRIVGKIPLWSVDAIEDWLRDQST
jgi:predicted DNA-binding transcriptional regulator AlpA